MMNDLKRNPAVQGGVSRNPSQNGPQQSASNNQSKRQVMIDEIYIFLPDIDDTEYQLRAKLRTMRNCSAALIANTDSDTARDLAWQCSHYATAHIYSRADNNALEEICRFCKRLMVVAMQVEAIDAAWDSGGL